MPKVNKLIAEKPWKYDELLPILKDAFRVLYCSYSKNFIKRQTNPYTKPIDAKKWFLEDAITDDLIEDEFNFAKNYDYSFIPQYKNINAKTRIDISVRYRLALGKYDSIEIECKQLKSDNIEYIITGGIEKFKQNKYAKLLPLAGMLLYNIQDKIPQNIEKLKERIERKYSSEEILTDFQFIDNHNYSYKSTHKRIDNTDLDLYSCAFDFSEIIQKQR